VYEAFYKLNASPFKLVPDSLFFYDSDTHRHGLVKLRQAVRNNCSITSVTGAPGTGKTELMRKFISEFDVRNTVVANIPLTSLRSNNILDYIATAFGVVNMGFVGDALWSKTAFLGKIQQQISSEICEGKKFVIFIDNAESLSRNCLNKVMQLCSVRIQGMPLAQCFLFGESSITANLKLDVTNLGLHTLSSVKLEAFDETETRRYIEHRLLEAGWQGDPEISDAAYKMIHHIAEGVPWHINLLCHRIFLQGFLEDTHVIDEQIVGTFLADKELESMGVSGSDVAVMSNVVNLKRGNPGSIMKGTSFSPKTKENKNSTQAVTSEMQDSISYFFDEYDKPHLTEEPDEEPIAIDVVLEAFNSSLNENTEGRSGYSDAKTGETFFPEINDKVEFEIDEQVVEDQLRSEIDLRIPLDSEHRARDSILEKIFPKTTAMLEDYAEVSPHKTYAAGNVPEFLQNDKSQSSDTIEEPEQILNEDVVPEIKSSVQIATRASIVTSLIITLVMWFVNDTRTADTQLAQATMADVKLKNNTQSSPYNVNTMTPSPFDQNDDRSRAKNILKQ